MFFVKGPHPDDWHKPGIASSNPITITRFDAPTATAVVTDAVTGDTPDELPHGIRRQVGSIDPRQLHLGSTHDVWMSQIDLCH